MPEVNPVSVTLKVSEDAPIKLTPEEEEEAILRVAELMVIGGDGTKDYNELDNKPQINSVELINNKSFDDLGLKRITNSQIEEIMRF